MTYIHQNLFRIETNHSRPHFNRECTSHISKMSEQEVTYSTLRFHKSSGLQNQVKPDETQEPREANQRECSLSWHVIVIPLGIFCSILMVTVAVLATHIYQHSQEKRELKDALNILHHNYSTMKNESYLKEEMLTNKSIECDSYKNFLDTLKIQQNKCHGETKIALNCSQNRGKRVDGYWFCNGIKCYYFIMGNKRWNGCKQICQNCSLSLLRIDDEDELKFLRIQITPDAYWIGLSYDNKKQEWAWIDNGPSKLSLNIMKSNVTGRRCMFLSKTRLEIDNCEKNYTCICEKRLYKFPDWLSNNR
ncbi:T-cell surface glycoprotein YE1/48-like isoform X4 [Apodemus sylvaticus]|nr:T-cell surface glycoprotein YE1/48-like isoform X4 [Apodemus sylvaticus]XP_052030998.1 T-cell surface glycoprotein YE1/48-like isoform X4 [Apodemus sylvaticus]XP_052030999.1 T-cell surface glycoprotein YE1/48-like isoform X4 [Apodemus sylvaticus]XP_052031000.1 T-cell surface glycoprotein YE1/48-like isoform X4 [Apodemus sylvaticus]